MDTGVAYGTMNIMITIPDHHILDALRERHGLALILLHGSQITGATHAKSDVDIAVLRHLHAPAYHLLELLNDLGQALHTDHIDVVDLTHADPLLLFAVIRHARLLAGDTSILSNLEQKAFHRYNDYQGYLTDERRFIKNRLASYVTH